MQKIIGAIKCADEQFNLFQDGDKIAIASSFGTDSMVLALALKRYCLYRKISLELTVFHVDIGLGDDSEKAVKYLHDLGLNVVIIKTRIKEILEQHLINNHYCCSRCSRLKKGALIKQMKELGFSKVVYGHHFDDIAETYLLNLIHNGKAETMPVIKYLDRDQVTLIRPLALAKKNAIVSAVKKEQIPIVISSCPRDKDSERIRIRQILEQIYKKYPQAESNFLAAYLKK